MNFKKVILIFVSVSGLAIATLLIARLTRVLQIYTVATPTMEPGYHVGDVIYASNLLQPQNGSLILYNERSGNATVDKYIKRVVAQSGDKIESREGVVYVNDQCTDSNLNLKFSYKLRGIDLETINADMKQMQLSETDLLTTAQADTVFLFLTKNQFELLKQKIWIEKNCYPKNLAEENICKDFKNKNWNRDNFGPYVVPKNTYFLLGDNRHNSLDSRYTGAIDKKDFAGTVLLSK